MSDQLPPPSIRVDAFGDILPTDGRRFVMGDFYTADQLRSYAEEAVRREREQIAAMFDDSPNAEMFRQDIADLIRSHSKE